MNFPGALIIVYDTSTTITQAAICPMNRLNIRLTGRVLAESDSDPSQTQTSDSTASKWKAATKSFYFNYWPWMCVASDVVGLGVTAAVAFSATFTLGPALAGLLVVTDTIGILADIDMGANAMATVVDWVSPFKADNWQPVQPADFAIWCAGMMAAYGSEVSHIKRPWRLINKPKKVTAVRDVATTGGARQSAYMPPDGVQGAQDVTVRWNKKIESDIKEAYDKKNLLANTQAFADNATTMAADAIFATEYFLSDDQENNDISKDNGKRRMLGENLLHLLQHPLLDPTIASTFNSFKFSALDSYLENIGMCDEAYIVAASGSFIVKSDANSSTAPFYSTIFTQSGILEIGRAVDFKIFDANGNLLFWHKPVESTSARAFTYRQMSGVMNTAASCSYTSVTAQNPQRYPTDLVISALFAECGTQTPQQVWNSSLDFDTKKRRLAFLKALYILNNCFTTDTQGPITSVFTDTMNDETFTNSLGQTRKWRLPLVSQDLCNPSDFANWNPTSVPVSLIRWHIEHDAMNPLLDLILQRKEVMLLYHVKYREALKAWAKAQDDQNYTSVDSDGYLDVNWDNWSTQTLKDYINVAKSNNKKWNNGNSSVDLAYGLDMSMTDAYAGFDWYQDDVDTVFREIHRLWRFARGVGPAPPDRANAYVSRFTRPSVDVLRAMYTEPVSVLLAHCRMTSADRLGSGKLHFYELYRAYAYANPSQALNYGTTWPDQYNFADTMVNVFSTFRDDVQNGTDIGRSRLQGYVVASGDSVATAAKKEVYDIVSLMLRRARTAVAEQRGTRRSLIASGASLPDLTPAEVTEIKVCMFKADEAMQYIIDRVNTNADPDNMDSDISNNIRSMLESIPGFYVPQDEVVDLFAQNFSNSAWKAALEAQMQSSLTARPSLSAIRASLSGTNRVRANNKGETIAQVVDYALRVLPSTEISGSSYTANATGYDTSTTEGMVALAEILNRIRSVDGDVFVDPNSVVTTSSTDLQDFRMGVWILIRSDASYTVSASNVDPMTGRPQPAGYDANTFAAECISNQGLYISKAISAQLRNVIKVTQKLSYYLTATTAPAPFKYLAKLVDFAQGKRGRPFYTQQEANAINVAADYRPRSIDPFYVSRTDEVVDFLYRRYDDYTPSWKSAILTTLTTLTPTPTSPVTRKAVRTAIENITSTSTPVPQPIGNYIGGLVALLINYGTYLGPRPAILPPLVNKKAIYSAKFMDAKFSLFFPAQNKFKSTCGSPNHLKLYATDTAAAVYSRGKTYRKYGDLIDYAICRGPRPKWLGAPPTGTPAEVSAIDMDVSPIFYV